MDEVTPELQAIRNRYGKKYICKTFVVLVGDLAGRPKPKNWSHRYVIRWYDSDKPEWHITHYHGAGQGPSGRSLKYRLGLNVSDVRLIQCAELNHVIVPVVIERPDVETVIYFGESYGQP